MIPLRPTRVEFDGTIESAVQMQRPPLDLQLPGIGSVIAHHGSFAFVGEHSDGHGEAIVMAIGRKPCTCGCGNVGQALMAYLPADEARALAVRLNAAAQKAEESADRLVADAFARAKRK